MCRNEKLIHGVISFAPVYCLRLGVYGEIARREPLPTEPSPKPRPAKEAEEVNKSPGSASCRSGSEIRRFRAPAKTRHVLPLRSGAQPG